MRANPVVSLLLVCVSLLAVRPAAAQQNPEREARSTTPTSTYRAHLLAVDGAGIATGAALMQFAGRRRDTQGKLSLLSSGMYGVGLVGAPTVHWIHRSGEDGFVSLALRAAMPPAGALLFSGINCVGKAGEARDGCGREGAAGGFLVAQVGASVIDLLRLDTVPNRARPGRIGTWYGWQTLLVDGAGLAAGTAMALAADYQGDPELRVHFPAYAVAIGPLLTGMLGTPIVHFAHGEWRTALADIGVRWLGVPLVSVAGIAGYCGATGGEEACVPSGAGWGLLAGTLLGASYDATVLAYESVEEPPGGTPDKQALHVVPSFQITPDRLTLSLGGRF